jgi:hypothetical protein
MSWSWHFPARAKPSCLHKKLNSVLPSGRKHPKRPKTEWKLKTKFLKKYALGTQSQGANWQKKEPSILPILHRKISKLKGKGHEPSRAENSSAQATAQASLARAHH